MSLENVRQLQEQVNGIRQACLDRTITEREVVDQIDKVIGGITRVDYKTGLKLKFTNGVMYDFKVRGIPKKLQDVIEGVAVLGYMKAQENGSMFPGEVHISRKASTHDHMDGIKKIAGRYEKCQRKQRVKS